MSSSNALSAALLLPLTRWDGEKEEASWLEKEKEEEEEEEVEPVREVDGPMDGGRRVLKDVLEFVRGMVMVFILMGGGVKLEAEAEEDVVLRGICDVV